MKQVILNENDLKDIVCGETIVKDNTKVSLSGIEYETLCSIVIEFMIKTEAGLKNASIWKKN